MPKHKDQRVGIFVDVQNLYYSAKQFYNSKVNFAHILNRASSNRQLIRAIAYVIKADIKEESNFFEALEKIGYDVRAKDLQTFYGGAKKGDWDVGIAMDIMRMASKLDVIVLVSGDGDFKDLLEHVKALGCRAEVIAFRKTCSSRLLREADEFIDLDKELDKVLIKHNKYTGKPGQKSSKKTTTKSSSSRSKSSSSRSKSKSSGKTSHSKTKSSHSKRRSSRRRSNHRKEHVSFMQKINMDQPELDITEAKKEDKKEKKPKKSSKKTRKKTTKRKSSKTKTKKSSKKKAKKSSTKKKSSGKKK